MDKKTITFEELSKKVWDFPQGCGPGKREFLEFVTGERQPLVIPASHEKVRVTLNFVVDVDFDQYRRHYGQNIQISEHELTQWVGQVVSNHNMMTGGYAQILSVKSREVTIERNFDEPEMRQEQEIVRDSFGRFASRG